MEHLIKYWQLYVSAELSAILYLVLLVITVWGKLQKIWLMIVLWLAAMGSALWLVVEIEKYFLRV